MSDDRLRIAVLACIIAIVLLLGLAGVAVAVHDSGGGTAAPATTTTTSPGRTTTTARGITTTTTTTAGGGTTTTRSGGTTSTTTTTYPGATTTTTYPGATTTTTISNTDVSGSETLAMTGRRPPLALVALLLLAAVSTRRLSRR
ncbi:MAG TPA: hypothetical protein VFJ85_00550 [Acidimicrobiales bacterium]|nr:hypothetical protein [Acidimicrobiales bacterium]